MATITSSKGLANVGVVAKHLQNTRHEMEQRKLELMGPKWNRDEATTTIKTKKPRKFTGLKEEHTTEPAGPDPGLQHTPVSPVLGPALQLQHTPRGPGQGLQQHTPMAPAPGPTPALHLQVTPSYRSPPGALEKASSSSSNTPLWPLPMSCSYSSPPGALAKANGCSSCTWNPLALPLPCNCISCCSKAPAALPCCASYPAAAAESGRSHLSVEEVASMGQGQVEKRAKTALALHAQDKSDIMNNDALVSFLHHMQVLELPVTNTVFKAVYSAVNGQGFVCSVSRMER
ncbi:hypothetical protein QJQ45_006772 [Haematococcus lacustris]|nr:hypothetical protein QJQ45_006772 [Haematococcus lacustris]